VRHKEVRQQQVKGSSRYRLDKTVAIVWESVGRKEGGAAKYRSKLDVSLQAYSGLQWQLAGNAELAGDYKRQTTRVLLHTGPFD
jgi:hypothetical protein